MVQKDNGALLNERLNDALYEQGRRFEVAMRCIIVFLLAAPLGCLIRRGGSGITVCISFFIDTLQGVGYSGTIPTIVGVWLPNIVLLLFVVSFS